MDKTVVELFAGVGGFRVGLNNIKYLNKDGTAREKKIWKFVWTNQWEPSTKAQHAYDCYVKRFSCDNASNIDILQIDKATIPNHTLLCGGFPCQDYSVARSLSNEEGINGKKGVLWWQIRDIVKEKNPPFILLENVDRLLKSPSHQRGRDFAIMLKCFDELGYNVERRVINAADYGHYQRRRRIFIFAYNKKTNYYKNTKKLNEEDILLNVGFFASIFKVLDNECKSTTYNLRNYESVVDVSESFQGKFYNSGYLNNGHIYTLPIEPIKKKVSCLANIIDQQSNLEDFILTNEQLEKFKYLKGSKKIERIDKNGFKYFYSEGTMPLFDSLDLPSRTMLTSEGTVNRSTHIILDPSLNKARFLTPLECERLNEFPDNRTDYEMSKRRRYFLMGNALVCGLINKIGTKLSKIIDEEK